MYASPPHLDMSTSGITNLFSTNVGAFQYLTESALVPSYPKDNVRTIFRGNFNLPNLIYEMRDVYYALLSTLTCKSSQIDKCKCTISINVMKEIFIYKLVFDLASL